MPKRPPDRLRQLSEAQKDWDMSRSNLDHHLLHNATTRTLKAIAETQLEIAKVLSDHTASRDAHGRKETPQS